MTSNVFYLNVTEVAIKTIMLGGEANVSLTLCTCLSLERNFQICFSSKITDLYCAYTVIG